MNTPTDAKLNPETVADYLDTNYPGEYPVIVAECRRQAAEMQEARGVLSIA